MPQECETFAAVGEELSFWQLQKRVQSVEEVWHSSIGTRCETHCSSTSFHDIAIYIRGSLIAIERRRAKTPTLSPGVFILLAVGTHSAEDTGGNATRSHA